MSGTFDQAFPNPPINPDDPGLAPEDVRFGIKYNWGGVYYGGILLLPTEDQVTGGVGYGAEGTEYLGTATDTITTGKIYPPVKADGSIKSPLYKGAAYIDDQAFKWTIPIITDVNLDHVELRFIHVDDAGEADCGNYHRYIGTIVENPVGIWNIQVNIRSKDSEVLDVDRYLWRLMIQSLDNADNWYIVTAREYRMGLLAMPTKNQGNQSQQQRGGCRLRDRCRRNQCQACLAKNQTSVDGKVANALPLERDDQSRIPAVDGDKLVP